MPILKQDEELTQEINQRREFHLKQINEVRKMAAPFPFAARTTLSLPSQRYIRFAQNQSLRLF